MSDPLAMSAAPATAATAAPGAPAPGTRRFQSGPQGLRRMAELYLALPVLALLLLAVLWIVTWQSIDSEREGATLKAQELNRELLDTYEAQIARSLVGIDQTLKVIKFAVELNGAVAALPTLRRQGLLPPTLVFGTAVIDSGGKVVASNPAGKSASAAGQPYFIFHQSHADDTLLVSQPLRTGPGPDAHLHFTRRINDAAGRFAGLAIVEVEPAYFTSGYELSRLGESGMLGLVGSEDKLFRVLRSGEQVSWGQSAAGLPALDPEGELQALIAWQGRQRYLGVRHLHGFALNVVVGLDQAEQLRPFRQQKSAKLWQAAMISATVLLLAGLCSFWSWQAGKTRRRIQREQTTYAAASEANLDAFFVLRSVFDGQGAIVDFVIDAANSRAEKLTGLARAAMCGRSVCTLWPEMRAIGVLDQLAGVARDGGVHEAEWEHRVSEHRVRWFHRQVVAVEDGVVTIVRDISSRKRAEERMLHIAHHDMLTGLPNRSLIGDRLDQAVLAAQRAESCVAVAFIDLDGFKMVNDALGHNAGDALLCEVAARMVRCVRRNDTVGRFGGDEFVLILSIRRGGEEMVTTLLEKIRDTLMQPVALDGQEVRVGCSIGVAIYPHDGDDANVLLKKADAAMYRAKETRQNSIQFYTHELSAKADEKLALLEGLRHALEERQFRLVYQPKVDLRSGRIIGVEALIRWQHPEQGTVSPLRFIPLAEESGLIVPIGEWVLQTACRQNQAWHVAGLGPLEMSVNVSPRQFEDLRLVARVTAALRDSGLRAGALELEVTEGVMMRDVQQSVLKMRELKAMGVSLSIDDFGTGYSSLSALKSFPISRLKIDKSFVNDLGGNADDQAIAMAIISLGHKLQLRVIAEGVETEVQRQFLRDNECDEMQGYLFSPPVSAEALQAMLEAQALLAQTAQPA
ncbi:MAG: EAL domain-containing protein [Pseudomonadota bacterium]